MTNSCKDCEKRTPGCHDRCADYQEYRAKRIETRRRRAEKVKKDSLLYSTHEKEIWRRLKRK